MWTPQNGDHLVCKNAISSQNLQIILKLGLRQNLQISQNVKICNFYVNFDTKVEKKGSLGVRLT